MLLRVGCGNCQVVCERTSWDGGYIGINSFGFGGSNVHVLLRSSDPAPSASATPHAAAMSARLVTCAGRTKEGVEATLAEASQHPADVRCSVCCRAVLVTCHLSLIHTAEPLLSTQPPADRLLRYTRPHPGASMDCRAASK